MASSISWSASRSRGILAPDGGSHSEELRAGLGWAQEQKTDWRVRARELCEAGLRRDQAASVQARDPDQRRASHRPRNRLAAVGADRQAAVAFWQIRRRVLTPRYASSRRAEVGGADAWRGDGQREGE